MGCCAHCAGADALFDGKRAGKDLRRYRRKGPDAGTRRLVEALLERGAAGLTVLDVGGGAGAIQHELARRGAAEVTAAEASRAYLEAAREQAEREGYVARARYLHGDLVAIADRVPEADVVTLDRVVCCYPDARTLVGASAAKARRLYGLVYPRERPLVRAFVALQNLLFWLRGSAFRLYVHPAAAIEAAVRAAGLSAAARYRTYAWEVAVFARQA